MLPMKASFVYVLSALLLLVWILEGGFSEKLRNILRSKLCWAFFSYFLIFVIGMLWTDDVTSGWAMVRRQIPLLLFLLYWSSAESKFRENYITAFIAGLSVCAILASYNMLQLHWLQEWPRGIRVFKGNADTAPFVDRILYTPILALGIYFSLWRVFSDEGAARILAITTSCLLALNLLFSGGRAGMVMFVALIIILIFQRTKKLAAAIIFCIVVIPLTSFFAYNADGYFAHRVDQAISDIHTFKENPNTSVGLRLVYWTTSFHVFLQHPLIGVGSGDFQKEYTQAKPAKWADTPNSYNPHNQFLMTAVTTGLVGFLILVGVFSAAIRGSNDKRMKAIILGFVVVCLFESYLWRSNTALTFSVIVAVLAISRNEMRLS